MPRDPFRPSRFSAAWRWLVSGLLLGWALDFGVELAFGIRSQRANWLNFGVMLTVGVFLALEAYLRVGRRELDILRQYSHLVDGWKELAEKGDDRVDVESVEF